MKPDYDTTLARMAGNIAGGIFPGIAENCKEGGIPISEADRITAKAAVRLARAIVAELKRTEPPQV